jgi:hypothetical protein
MLPGLTAKCERICEFIISNINGPSVSNPGVEQQRITESKFSPIIQTNTVISPLHLSACLFVRNTPLRVVFLLSRGQMQLRKRLGVHTMQGVQIPAQLASSGPPQGATLWNSRLTDAAPVWPPFPGAAPVLTQQCSQSGLVHRVDPPLAYSKPKF